MGRQGTGVNRWTELLSPHQPAECRQLCPCPASVQPGGRDLTACSGQEEKDSFMCGGGHGQIGQQVTER